MSNPDWKKIYVDTIYSENDTVMLGLSEGISKYTIHNNDEFKLSPNATYYEMTSNKNITKFEYLSHDGLFVISNEKEYHDNGNIKLDKFKLEPTFRIIDETFQSFVYEINNGLTRLTFHIVIENRIVTVSMYSNRNTIMIREGITDPFCIEYDEDGNKTNAY